MSDTGGGGADSPRQSGVLSASGFVRFEAMLASYEAMVARIGR